MPRIPWFTRKFKFDFPSELYPEILERLLGTPILLGKLIKSINSDVLTKNHEERWSIQENAGHLIDLEPLWYCRIEDILSGVETMRPADLTNQKTYQAEHNARKITDILAEFSRERGKLTDRLASLSLEDFARSALHPRLEKPMRIIDLCFFVAEHDDFHLANIRELSRLLEREL